MKTIAMYTVNFRNYGEITVPEGTRTTHKTAVGIDPKIHFVDEFEWVKVYYPEIENILRYDLETFGINVPKEFIEGYDPLAGLTPDQVEKYNEERMTDSYVLGQLAKIEPNGEYGERFKISSTIGETKYISLNKHTARLLVEWLKTNYDV